MPQALAHGLQREAGIAGVEPVAGLGEFGLAEVLRGEDDAVLHVAVGRDEDDEHPALAQAQELDVVEDAGLLGRRDDADKARQVGQQLRGAGDDALGLIGLQLGGLDVDQARLGGQHGVDEQAVAARRGDAASTGVGAGDQAELFQVGHHVADGGRAELQAGGLGQGARTHGLAVGDIPFNQGFEQGFGSLVEHGRHSRKRP
mmetsp:Transcript_15303/g.36388  ORF Transcript_15303/g.36388 Transcript_15303/m.36388 type:complete len:202 (-) Transcript_15303:1810-2415(-)